MRRTYWTVLLGTLAVVLLCVVMLCRVHRRLVVSVDGFRLPGSEAVTLGRGSDVCLDDVPHDFLAIHREGDGFRWEVSTQCLKTDSLCYFKVKNTNPNLHPLPEDGEVVVTVGDQRHTITTSEIVAMLDGQDSRYVLLRNVLEKRRVEGSSAGPDFRTLKEVRSLICRTAGGFLRPDGPWQLLILDNHTTLHASGGTTGYTPSGTTGSHCKVQFYRVAEYSFQSGDDIFHIGDVNYMAKPVTMRTSWGAGHVMLRADAGDVQVCFPKPLTYSEDLGVLRQLAGSATSMLTLVQTDGSLPVGRSLFIPQFSTHLRQEVCHVRLSGDSVFVAGHEVKSPHGLLPALQPMEVDDGAGLLQLHTAIIGPTFAFSYLWLPLAVLLVVLLVYPLLMQVDRLPLRGKTYWAGHLPSLFQLLAVIAFAYCVCRTMVAFKLSWTHPYFEKLTGVTTTSAALMLLLFYNLSLLLNHSFLTARPTTGRVRGKVWQPWIALGVSVVILAACLAAQRALDGRFSAPMLAAYLPGEVFTLNILRWPSCDGINELHRSVPYTLALANVLCALALLLMAIPALGRLMVRTRSVRQRGLLPQRTLDRLLKGVGRLFPAKMGKGNVSAIVTATGYALLAALASVIPGNFSTAVITLVLVTGMGHALLLVEYADNRVWAFITSIVITLLMLIGAIAMPGADKGYFTNYLAFATMAVLLYVVVSKYSRRNPTAADLKANRREHLWMNVAMGATLLLVLLVVPKVLSMVYNPEEVDYDRTSRRFQMFSQFDNYRDSGYRYAVSDTEFMTVMMHGMYNATGADPLSPERHPLHPSVSTGLSPVVLNDVSLPLAFFGTYGWGAYVAFFALIVLLLVTVTAYTLPPATLLNRGVEVDVRMLWRILAVLMWACTSFYLYASYVGQFPFTGRLCPGYGVDSVGEALESMSLLAFMTATLLKTETTGSRL